MKGFAGLNRWGAVAIVFVAMIAALALVGTEENSDALLSAAEQIGQKAGEGEEQATTEPEPAALPTPVIPEVVEEEPIVEFATDEELIVDPTGIDPSPIITNPAEGEEIEVETIEE